MSNKRVNNKSESRINNKRGGVVIVTGEAADEVKRNMERGLIHNVSVTDSSFGRDSLINDIRYVNGLPDKRKR